MQPLSTSFNWLLARLSEASSYAGIAIVLGSAATQLAAYPNVQHVFMIAAAVCGALAFGIKEEGSSNKG